MSEIGGITEISSKVNNLVSILYKYENSISVKEVKNDKGYLIDYQIMENFKKNILYDEIKLDIAENKEHPKNKDKIERTTKFKEIKKIVQTKFNNSNELLEKLNQNKRYYLIDYSLWFVICEESKRKEDGINYNLEKDKIILIFNDNDILTFKKNNGIIEKSSLYKTENNHDNINNNTNINDEQKINNNLKVKNVEKQMPKELNRDKAFLKCEKEFDILVTFIYNNYLLNEELEKSKTKQENNNDYISKLKLLFS